MVERALLLAGTAKPANEQTTDAHIILRQVRRRDVFDIKDAANGVIPVTKGSVATYYAERRRQLRRPSRPGRPSVLPSSTPWMAQVRGSAGTRPLRMAQAHGVTVGPLPVAPEPKVDRSKSDRQRVRQRNAKQAALLSASLVARGCVSDLMRLHSGSDGALAKWAPLVQGGADDSISVKVTENDVIAPARQQTVAVKVPASKPSALTPLRRAAAYGSDSQATEATITAAGVVTRTSCALPRQPVAVLATQRSSTHSCRPP